MLRSRFEFVFSSTLLPGMVRGALHPPLQVGLDQTFRLEFPIIPNSRACCP